MEHLENALILYFNLNDRPIEFEKYITLDSINHSVTFKVQNGTIPSRGMNGTQVTDVLEFILELYKSFNAECSCRENSLTITKIEEAIMWQHARTKNRTKRGVEGTSMR